MTSKGEDGSSSSSLGNVAASNPASADVSFLEKALWKQFNRSRRPEDYLQAWLALQCRMIPGSRRALVVLGESDAGPFVPAAFWPNENVISSEFSSITEFALKKRRGAVRGDRNNSEARIVAYPMVFDDHLYGAIAVEVANSSAIRLREVVQQIKWGISWVEVLLHRQNKQQDENQLEQAKSALHFVSEIIVHDKFRAACDAVVTQLATKLTCSQVGIGFMRRGRAAVVSLSHTAQFGKRMNLVRDLGAVMDEAIDQARIVLYPPPKDSEYFVTQVHEKLAHAHEVGSIITIPLSINDRLIGALTLERPHDHPFDQESIELCDCIAAVVGPVLEEKRHNDRWIMRKMLDSASLQLKRMFGPRYLGRKLLALLLVLMVLFFSFTTGNYQVTAPSALEGIVQRSVVAPFDGYIATENARAGETVKKNELLATLDERDLVLEQLRWTTTRSQRLTEYNRALSQQERADTNIIKAQIEQAEAQIALLDEQINRTKLTAPFDGIVVFGDLSQKIGASVRRGDQLFKVAPLNSYRVILKIDESDIAEIREGQLGQLIVSSLPEDALMYKIRRITPITEAEEGRNFFRVEAELLDSNERLRPGMEGVAKTDIDSRRLIWIWTHKLLNWLRVTFWTWLP